MRLPLNSLRRRYGTYLDSVKSFSPSVPSATVGDAEAADFRQSGGLGTVAPPDGRRSSVGEVGTARTRLLDGPGGFSPRTPVSRGGQSQPESIPPDSGRASSRRELVPGHRQAWSGAGSGRLGQSQLPTHARDWWEETEHASALPVGRTQRSTGGRSGRPPNP